MRNPTKAICQLFMPVVRPYYTTYNYNKSNLSAKNRIYFKDGQQ